MGKKSLWIGLGCLAAVAVLGALVLPGVVGRAVGSASESSLGVASRVESVQIDWLRGGMTLAGVQVDAPPGFSGDYALAVASIAIHPRLGSAFGDVLVVDSLVISGVDLVMEQRGASISTRELARHIETYLASSEGDSGKPIRVGVLRFEGGTARIQSQAGELGSVQLPSMTLREVGGTEGVPLPTLIANIVEPILSAGSPGGSSLSRLRDRLGL